MLTRLEAVKPFSMHMPMVAAAAISPASLTGIEYMMQRNGQMLRQMIHAFLRWLRSPDGRRAAPGKAQRRLTLLRLRFGAILSQFDIFAEAVTQRSEHDYGVWLSGLDVLAEDAIRVPGFAANPPPMICYLERGLGAAIRKMHTRLPGGGQSPVTVIRVPRERMIGSAVGSSLVHEVGHQAAALLRLVPSLQEEMAQRAAQDRSRADAWRQFRRWASEIVADFWSVGKVGITGSLGIMSVVSLPRPFVFHFAARDVHPAPWLRVKLSCAMGNCLFPNPQWGRLADMWEQLYPAAGLKHELADRIARLDAMIPVVARLVANHRPPSLKGKSMREIMPVGRRQPRQLLDRFDRWKKNPGLMNDDPPTLVFSVLGQAKWAGKINAGDEGRLLNKTLKYWAFKRALQTGDSCVIGARSTALKIAMNSLSVR